MSDSDRRRVVRREVKFPVVLMMASGSLDGETIDINRDGGLLIQSTDRVRILLQFEGKEFRGRLVRATPIDENKISYAIQLEDPVS